MIAWCFAAQLAVADMASAAGRFHEAAGWVEAGNYSEAEPLLRALKEDHVPYPEIYESAVHLHGLVLAEVDRVPEALLNFERIVLTSDSPVRQQRALEAWVHLGGKIPDLLPRASLEEAAAAWIRDTLSTPPPQNWLDQMSGDLAAAARMLGAPAICQALGMVSNQVAVFQWENPPDSLRGSVTLRSPTHSIVLEARAGKGRWRFIHAAASPRVEEDAGAREAEDQRIARHGSNRNFNVLRMLGARLAQHLMTHDPQPPPTLPELAGGYEQMEMWEHPDTMRTESWLYRTDWKAPAPGEWIVLAAPRPVRGLREVLLMNGRTLLMEDPVFLETIREQGWDLPDAVSVQDVPENQAIEIQKWILQLSQGNRKERREAKEALQGYGTRAAPFLRPLLESDDPELRFTAEELYQP